MNKNLDRLNSFPKESKNVFINFIKDINNLGYWVNITSGHRTYSEQYKLWFNNRQNAPAGTSPHEFHKAIDINLINKKTGTVYLKKTSTEAWTKTGILNLCEKYNLKWGGNSFGKYKDRVHFQINSLSNVKEYNNEEYKKYTYEENWNTEINKELITDKKIEYQEDKIEEYITKISEINTKEATGIWQIIKLVADQYSLSQNINDATIATSQGSLLNYIQKVVQKPWLQFFGDTVGDQYYFQCRKEPFDYDGYSKLPVIKSIQENEVLSDELSWYDGEIFSWYQIIPKGSFLGEQDLIFAYVKAVFFEEYAEIWGSKPNIQVSNYVNFINLDEDNKMFSKAIKDLRYMVESNAYLPFSRQGTIVITGDNTIRRGYKIFYEPTGEFFYIDSITHNYSVDDSGPSYTTTLRVSRGVIKKYFSDYFNIINFSDPEPLLQEYEEEFVDESLFFYFDNGRNYLIDLNENFLNSTSRTDFKMLNQINEFPNLRNELYDLNLRYINKISEFINRNKNAEFLCFGNMDEDSKLKFSKLSKQRAETIRHLIITEYLKKYKDFTYEQLKSKIEIVADINSTTPYIPNEKNNVDLYDDGEPNNSNLKEKAYKRNVVFQNKPYNVKKTKEIPQKGVAWYVNREIFYKFLNRKQFVSDVR